MLNSKAQEWPPIIAQKIADHKVHLTLEIPPTLSWFEGHFPNHPLLPGVVQARWAVDWAKQFFAIEGDFEKVENLKFKAVILPKTTVELTMHCTQVKKQTDAPQNIVKFSYKNNAEICSEGKITFG